MRGLAYLSSHELDKALADLNKAVELDPENALMYTMRAFVFDAKGDLQRAAADREKAKQLTH
jgi:Tfp pilus assembly protein PilF